MPGKPIPPEGALDFEATDLDAARRTLDEPPPGVEEVKHLAPGYWERRRRVTQPSDRALTGAALDWLMALPVQQRPRLMCERFPRIVNHIAENWNDRAGTVRALGRLLVDERGGRQGFPKEIDAEIARLRDYAAGA